MRADGILGALLVASLLATQAFSIPKESNPPTEGCLDGDDALDPRKEPRLRAMDAMVTRMKAAHRERDGSKHVCQISNGDRTSDGSPLLEAKFHKTLPHDSLGQVDPEDFGALQDCIFSGDFETCEQVPAGDESGYLINPLGGIAVDIAGPAGSAVSTPPFPGLDTAELAGQLAECYWMALTRDVPFSQYGTNEVTQAAAANLASMPGFPLAEYDVAMNHDGSIDPMRHLFRPSFIGVDKGPMISQLLCSPFTMDSMEIDPKATTVLRGDFMTDYDSWLHIQNGGAPDVFQEEDPIKRYIRNGRDLARLVFTDTIYSEAFRGTLVLMQKGGISGEGFIGPYADSNRQKGFVQYGASHVMRMLGRGEGAQRASWYQKWNVHLMARPEALAGLVHNTLIGALEAPIHVSLLENSELLDRVYAANDAQNEANGISGTYLLSQAASVGSPSHPSYPAGHAVQNGAFATVLKAMCGLEHGRYCFPDPLVTDDEGLDLLTYEPSADETCIGSDGEETYGLTYEGEINKLAANVAFGRGIMGVHYRLDSSEGMVLGETVAIRMLHQEVIQAHESFDMEFRLFRGQIIKLSQDGTFSIDGVTCRGPVFTGVSEC